MTRPTLAGIDLEAYMIEPDAPEWSAFRAHFPTCRECSSELATWSRLEDSLRAAAAPSEPLHPSDEDALEFLSSWIERAPEQPALRGPPCSA